MLVLDLLLSLVKFKPEWETYIIVCACVEAHRFWVWEHKCNSSHHLTTSSVFVTQEFGIDWSNLCASVNLVMTGGGKWKKLTECRGITVHGVIREIGYFPFYFPCLVFNQEIGIYQKKKDGISARFDKALETHQKERGMVSRWVWRTGKVVNGFWVK